MRKAGWEWGGNKNEAKMRSQEWRRGRSESEFSVAGWSRRPQALKGGKQEGLYLLKNALLEGLGEA